MKKSTNALFGLALATFVFFGVSTAAQAEKVYTAEEMKEAAKVYKKICFQCHGKDGEGKARINKKTGEPMINAMMGPRIAGLDEKYAAAQLKAIHEGVRKNRNTISMKSKISKLSEQEMAALSHYVSVELGKTQGKYKGMLEGEAKK